MHNMHKAVLNGVMPTTKTLANMYGTGKSEKVKR